MSNIQKKSAGRPKGQVKQKSPEEKAEAEEKRREKKIMEERRRRSREMNRLRLRKEWEEKQEIRKKWNGRLLEEQLKDLERRCWYGEYMGNWNEEPKTVTRKPPPSPTPIIIPKRESVYLDDETACFYCDLLLGDMCWNCK